MIHKCLYRWYYTRPYDKIKHQSGRFTDSNEGKSVCLLENKFVSKNDSRVLISGTTRQLSTERPEKMLFSCRLFLIYANVRHLHTINFKASLPFSSINIFSYHNHNAFKVIQRCFRITCHKHQISHFEEYRNKSYYCSCNILYP